MGGGRRPLARPRRPAAGRPQIGSGGDQASVTVWLPGEVGRPTCSPQLVWSAVHGDGATSSGEAGGVWPFAVPCLRLEPGRGLDLLLALAGLDSPELRAGPSVAALGSVGGLALEIVAGGRALPELVAAPGAPYRARWAAVGRPADERRAGQLAAALPPLCRALHPDGSDPGGIVRSALAAFVDVACRDALRQARRRLGKGGRRGGRPPSPVEAWLEALAGEVWRSPRRLSRLTQSIEAPQEVLLGELGRAARTYPELATALAEAAPTHLVTDLAGAHRFLSETAITLQAAGFGVLLPSWWRRPSARLGVKLTASRRGGGRSSGLLGSDGLLDFDWQAALGDDRLSLADLDRLARLKQPLVRVRGRWVELRPGEAGKLAEFVRSGRRSTERAMSVVELLRIATGAEELPIGVPVTGVEVDGPVGALLRGDLDEHLVVRLPDKLEMKVICSLTREQATLYRAVVDEMLAEIDASEGIQRGHAARGPSSRRCCG